MSAEAFVQALHHSQATGTAKVVMLAIANYEGENGAWCSMSTLAKIANVHIDNVRKHVRTLEELGELRTDPNGGYQMNKPKHMRTNLYEITIECPEWCDRSMNHRDTRLSNSGPTKSPDRRNRRTDENAGQGPAKSPDEPKDNQLPNQTLNETNSVTANDRVSNLDIDQKAEIAETARQRMIADRTRGTSQARYTTPPAPSIPRFDPASIPAALDDVSPEQQEANTLASALRCPEGFGTGSGSRHLILVRTGEGCARCGLDSFSIIDQANAPTEASQ